MHGSGDHRADADALHQACPGSASAPSSGPHGVAGDGRRVRRGPYVVGALRGEWGQLQVVPGGHGLLTVGPATRESLAREIDRLARS